MRPPSSPTRASLVCQIAALACFITVSLGNAQAAGPRGAAAKAELVAANFEQRLNQQRRGLSLARRAITDGRLRAKSWEVTIGGRLCQAVGGGLMLGLGKATDSFDRRTWRCASTPAVDVGADGLVPVSLGVHLRRGNKPRQLAQDLDGCEVKVGGGGALAIGGRAYVGRGKTHRVISLHADVGVNGAAGVEVARPVPLASSKPRDGKLLRRITEGERLTEELARQLEAARQLKGKQPDKAMTMLTVAARKLDKLQALREKVQSRLIKRLAPAPTTTSRKKKASPAGKRAKTIGALLLAGLLTANNLPLVTGGIQSEPLHEQAVAQLVLKPGKEQRQLLGQDSRSSAPEAVQKELAQIEKRTGFNFKVQTMLRIGGDAGNRAARLFLSGRVAYYKASTRLVGALGAMFKELDHGGPIYFRHDLRALMNKPQVLRFLTELNRQLSGGGEGKVDLYQLAQKHSKSPKEAARWLGVLFQDVSREQEIMHVRLLRDPAKQRLLRTAVVHVTKASPDKLVRYPGGWFPSQRNDETDDQLYHYWVIRHAAQRLNDRGFRPLEAFGAPFLLNTEYEVIGNAIKSSRNPLGTLLGKMTIAGDAAQVEHTLRHSYAGYRGALDGAGLRGTPLTYEAFSARLKGDTFGAIQQLLSNPGQVAAAP